MIKKGQGAVEFVVLFGFLMFFFVVFFSIIQSNVNDRNLEKLGVVAQNIALDVQEELSLAAESSDGYSRQFEIPKNLLGKDYNITVEDGRVFVSAEKIGISYRVVNVSGNVTKGSNIIKKENGGVILN